MLRSQVVSDVELTVLGKGDALGVLAALTFDNWWVQECFLGWLSEKQRSRVLCAKKSEDTTFCVLVFSASLVQVERPLNEVGESGWGSAAAVETLCSVRSSTIAAAAGGLWRS